MQTAGVFNSMSSKVTRTHNNITNLILTTNSKRRLQGSEVSPNIQAITSGKGYLQEIEESSGRFLGHL